MFHVQQPTEHQQLKVVHMTLDHEHGIGGNRNLSSGADTDVRGYKILKILLA